MSDAHTPGPWNLGKYGAISGGKPTKFANGTAQMQILMSMGHEGMENPEAEREANARLAAAAPDLLTALREARRAIGDHFAPDHCYATGPMTGNDYRDLVECPACSAISMFNDAIAKATGEMPC